MIYFRSDYSQGAHPKVMDALVKTNFEHRRIRIRRTL